MPMSKNAVILCVLRKESNQCIYLIDEFLSLEKNVHALAIKAINVLILTLLANTTLI